MTMSLSRVTNRVVVYGFLFALLILFMGPLLIIWSSAFKSNPEIAASPFSLPTTLRLENFVNAWTEGNFGQYTLNSLIIASVTTLIVAVCSVLGGYALSSLPLPGANGITLFLLLGLSIPLHGIIIPQYLLMRNLGLINNLLAVILLLSALNIPFGVYLIRGFFIGLSHEIGDSARIDGCNEWQALLYVLAPIAFPAISSLIVFCFMWSWNDLLLPLIYLQSDSLRTVSVGLTFYQGKFSVDYALTAAGTTIATLPVIIVYILFQRQFVAGVTGGSMAGS